MSAILWPVRRHQTCCKWSIVDEWYTTYNAYYKITPNLLLEYQCTSGKFIRLPNEIDTFLPELECSTKAIKFVSEFYNAFPNVIHFQDEQRMCILLFTSVVTLWEMAHRKGHMFCILFQVVLLTIASADDEQPPEVNVSGGHWIFLLSFWTAGFNAGWSELQA